MADTDGSGVLTAQQFQQLTSECVCALWASCAVATEGAAMRISAFYYQFQREHFEFLYGTIARFFCAKYETQL
jgi:hypothetical protein